MKNIIENIDEAMQIVNELAQFDLIAVQSILCMACDTAGLVHGEDPTEIAEKVYTAVTAINQEYGAYAF